MQTQQAMKFAGFWVEAHGDNLQEAAQLRNWLTKELESTLSEEASVGVALIEDAPVVVALDGDALITVTVTSSVEGEIHPETVFIPLGSSPVLRVSGTIEVRDTVKRQRIWRIEPFSAQATALVTHEVMHSAFTSDIGPDSGEVVMQEVAATIAEGPRNVN